MDKEEAMQKAFNDSIGVILTYLDEADVGMAIKRAVKTELWSLHDNKVAPLVKGLGEGGGSDVTVKITR
jgi:hypothetical protein